MIVKYSQLHTVLTITLTGKYQPRKIPVYKNPTSRDYTEINKRFREEFPFAPKNEPKTRFTYDEDGNRYIWMSSDGLHFTVEEALYKQHGIKTDQNADMYLISKDKFTGYA